MKCDHIFIFFFKKKTGETGVIGRGFASVSSPPPRAPRHYGTRHHTIDLGDWAMTSEALLELFRHFDQPFADTSLVPMYWISRAVREHGIICTLSGDGGDEAFGGYENFRRAHVFPLLMRP